MWNSDIEQLIGGKLASEEGKEEKDEGNIKSRTTLLPALEGISYAKKYLMRFDCNDYVITVPSSVESEVYRVYQKAKKQPTLIDMWRK